MEFVAFAVSAAVAQILTNIDNLVLALALGLTAGRGRALAAYVMAQLLVLLFALGLGSGLGQVLHAHVRWLGLLPLALGLRGVMWGGASATGVDGSNIASASGWTWLPMAVAVFLGLSMDSLSLMTPLLAESRAGFRLAALAGALCGIALMSIAASLAGHRGARLARLERLLPWVLILAGLYVLWDSGTDLA